MKGRDGTERERESKMVRRGKRDGKEEMGREWDGKEGKREGKTRGTDERRRFKRELKG